MHIPFIETAHAADVLILVPSSTTSSNLLIKLGNNVYNILIFLGAVVAVLYIVIGGYRYITSGGSPEKAKMARATIVSAVIGLIIVTLAFFFVRLAGAVAREADCAQYTEALAHANCLKR